MLRNHGSLNLSFARMARIILLIAILFAFAMPSVAQQTDITITKPPAPTGEDPLLKDMQSAQATLNDGLTTMNEDTLRRAAAQYEQIIVNYENDPRYFDAYFVASFIYMEYLQTVPDYEHAQNLLTELITKHPSNYAQVIDALLTRAHLEYRCLMDYRAAQEDLSAILNSMSLSTELGDRDIEVKTLLAKCRQKLGEYPEAKKIWEEVAISNPEMDTEGRAQWIKNGASWSIINDTRVRLFFENDISQAVYSDCMARVHDGLTESEIAFKLTPTLSVDVYLYSSAGHLFDYTRRTKPFALPVDAEIHLAASDLDSIGHLTGWVNTQRLNSRPDETVFPFLRAGFQHYFMDTQSELNSKSAKEIYFYGGSIPDSEILFPLSFDYTYSDEFATMSASFLHYLIEDRGVSFASLEKFYRLLWSKPDSRDIPPLIAALMTYKPSDLKIMNYQQDALTADQVYGLSQSVLGINMVSELAGWQKSLAPDIEAVKAELGNITDQVQKVQVDLTTPDKALQSWWDAYRSGDFNALISASSKEMADMLKDARDMYIKQGIFEQVIQENFIRPYHSATMNIVTKGQFAEDLYVYQINIVKGSETKEMSIVVRQEGKLWKVDSN
jgi:tetratricopeptide (TPR) repeat protein